MLGGLLVLVGLLLAVGSLVVFGEYPTGLSTPVAVAVGVSAIVVFGTGLLALGLPRGRATRASPTPAAVAALIAGIASATVFVVLVGANLSMSEDTTIPAAGRWAPLVVGGAALVLGIVGLATSRGDGPSRRVSLAGALLGLGPAVTAIWLSSANCWLFVDRAAGCSMP